MRNDLVQHIVDSRGRNHQPDGARLRELADEILNRSRAAGALAHQLLHIRRIQIEHDTLVSAPGQPPNHIGPHAAESNHSKLHSRELLLSFFPILTAPPAITRAALVRKSKTR